jgi:hypothetical protein
MAETGWEGRPWLHSYRSQQPATAAAAANSSSGHAQLTNGAAQRNDRDHSNNTTTTSIVSQPLLSMSSRDATLNRTASFAASLLRPSTGARASTSFTFVRYNVTSDVLCTKYRHTASRSWVHRRRTTLINEIASYDAEILALQNVDHFYDWWRPQLALLGYDTVAKPATHRTAHRDDCVLLAYKRHLFQLFKSWDVELNESRKTTDDRNLVERVASDDVGIIALIQPFKHGALESAICVASVAFSDRDTDSDVRLHQCKYFMGQVEEANGPFQVTALLDVFKKPRVLLPHRSSSPYLPLFGPFPCPRAGARGAGRVDVRRPLFRRLPRPRHRPRAFTRCGVG